jgi:hypothetical protein
MGQRDVLLGAYSGNTLKKLGGQEESNCALDLCFPSSISTDRK